MFRRRIKLSKLLRKIYTYDKYLERRYGEDSYIAGFKIKIGKIEGSDPTFKAYTLQKGYENLFKALNRMKIPIMAIYTCRHGEGNSLSGLYLITKARDGDELGNRLRIIESTFYAVFPDFKLTALSGRELANIMLFNKTPLVEGEDNMPAIFYEHPMPTESIPDAEIPKFYIPVIEESDESEVHLGYIVDSYSKENSIPYRMPLSILESHVVCLGVTGSGKSTTICKILNQLPEHIKFIVFDYHNEYGDRLKNYDMILKPGKDEDSAINPLEPMYSPDIGEHISVISDIFGDIYDFTHPQIYFFKLSLEATIANYKALGESEPNLKALVEMIERYPIKSYYDNESKAALLRRLKPLINGQAKKAFISKNYLRIEELLERNVIVELGHLREHKVRQIYTQLLLKIIYDYRLSRGLKTFNHITVIEEARHIVPYRRDYEKPSIAEKMIGELRKFGESIFLVTQFPSQISRETIKNANTLIVHRLTGEDDLRTILTAIPLNREQIEYIKKMDVGEAIIKEKRYTSPILVKITI